jgi:acylphosphatase
MIMAEEAVKVIYKGVVQGVGFRYSAKAIAARHKINGWVRNLPNGDVELYAYGRASAVRNFLRELAAEFKHGISDISLNDDLSGETVTGFQIRF